MKKLMNTNSFSTAIKSVSILLVALLFSVGAFSQVPSAAPVIGAATAGATSTTATVNFTAPATNTGATITSYSITSTPAGASGTINSGLPSLGAASSIPVTGLIPGTYYTFVVYATNGSGNSATSAASNTIIAGAGTAASTTPGAPTIASAQPITGSTTAFVYVYPPANTGGSAIVKYTIQAYNNSTGATAGTTLNVTVANGGLPVIAGTVTGLTANTAYYFKATATNGAGVTSAQSAASYSINTGAPTPLDVYAIWASSTSATVNFTAPLYATGAALTNALSGTNTYQVIPYDVTTGTTLATTYGTATPITVSSLTTGHQYTFTVLDSVQVAGLKSPASVASLPLTITSTSPATLTWTGTAGDGLWSTATNWTGNVLPSATSNVSIPASATVTISNTTAAYANNITLAAGASLTNNGNLTINTVTASTSLIMTDATFDNEGALLINTLNGSCISFAGTSGTLSNTFVANGTISINVSPILTNYLFSVTATDPVNINGAGFTLGSAASPTGFSFMNENAVGNVTISSSTVITDYIDQLGYLSSNTWYGLNMGVGGSFTNNGTLNFYYNSQSKTGYVFNIKQETTNVSFTNTGTINIYNQGNNAFNLGANSTGIVTINNSGTINYAGSYFVACAAGVNSVFNNTGTITLTTGYELFTYTSNSNNTQQFNNTYVSSSQPGILNINVTNGSSHTGAFLWAGTPTAPTGNSSSITNGQTLNNTGTINIQNTNTFGTFATQISTVGNAAPTISNSGKINFNTTVACTAFIAYQNGTSYSTTTTYVTGNQIAVAGYIYTATNSVGAAAGTAPGTWVTTVGSNCAASGGGTIFQCTFSPTTYILPVLTNTGTITGYNVTFPAGTSANSYFVSSTGTLSPSANGTGTGTITLPTSYPLTGTFSPQVVSNTAYGILGGTTVNYSSASVALNTTFAPTTATLGPLNITAATASNSTSSTSVTGAPSGWSISTSSGTTSGFSISYSSSTFPAPTAVSATGLSPTSASVSFTAPASFGAGTAASLYTVTSSPGNITATGTTPAGITVTGLTPGIAYTFTVTCTNNATVAGTSAASVASSAITLVSPAAPTSITATATSTTSITVSWTGSSTYGTGGGSAWSSYTLTAIPISGSSTVITNATSPYTFTATAGVAYTFTVTATNSGSPTVTSAAATSTTVSYMGTPTIGTATINGATSAAVSFTTIGSYGAGATGVTYTAISSPGGLIGTGVSSPITVSGLTAGTSYTFTVTATNNAPLASTSAASAASNSVIAGTPSIPTSVSAFTTGSTTATINWAVPTTTNSLTGYTATVYLLGVAQGTPAPQAVSSSTYTANFSSLTPGTTYTIGVYATNATGNSNIVYSGNITTSTTSTFNGPGTDWNTSGNWSNGIPTALTDVTIASNAIISSSTAALANSITINSGITLTNNGTGSGSLTVNTGTNAVGITITDATFDNEGKLSVTTSSNNCVAFSGSAGGSTNNNFVANGTISFSATAPTTATSTEYYVFSATGTDSSTIKGNGFSIGNSGAGVGFGLISSAVATKLTVASGTTINDYLSFTPAATYNIINLTTASQTLYNKGTVNIYQPATCTATAVYPVFVNSTSGSTINFTNTGTYYDTLLGNWSGFYVQGGGSNPAFNLNNSGTFSSLFTQSTGNAITVVNIATTITNSNTLTLRGYYGFNLQANAAMTQSIVNSGTITSNSSAHGGFGWTASASATQTVTNTGTINIGSGSLNNSNGGFQTAISGTGIAPVINNNTGGIINIAYYTNASAAFILGSGSVYAQIVNSGGLLEGNFTVPTAACLSTNTSPLGTLSPLALNGTGVGAITLPTSYALYGTFAPVFTTASAYGTIAGTTLALGNTAFAPVVPSTISSSTATTAVTSASPTGSNFLSTSFTNAPGCGVSYTTSWSLTFSAVAPGAPTIGTATAGNAQASVTFTAPANLGRGTGTISYNLIPYDESTSTTLTAITGASSPINTGSVLTNGDTYHFNGHHYRWNGFCKY